MQTLAVIGREFSLSLLEKVVDESEKDLYRLLSHLQALAFVERRSTDGCPTRSASYSFPSCSISPRM